MAEDRPPWARRMTNERRARNWSQADAVRAMQAHAADDDVQLPDAPSLLRQWMEVRFGQAPLGSRPKEF